jgi:2-polyprenyl-3-methyl-5-hydroxy-6-metoxy-1,4-benzoquinol methylase
MVSAEKEDVVNEIQIDLSPRFLDAAVEVARDLQQSIGLHEPWTSLQAAINARARVNYVQQVEQRLKISLQKRKVLEIGSGMGLFVLVARKLGIDCVGVEPCSESYANLRCAMNELLESNGESRDVIQQQGGECLPWPDNTFDVVVSFQVLEHVADPQLMLSEAFRVLKPGGQVFMDMPNHFSFTEGHYGIVWLPPLAWSKDLARLYVRLFGKNANFLNELNLITPSRVRRWMDCMPGSFCLHSAKSSVRSPTSPSTMDKQIVVRMVEPRNIPEGQRFGRVGRYVRRQITSSFGRSCLAPFGLVDHLWLQGKKHGAVL